MVVVERELPSDEARALISLVREVADAELAPRAAQAEARAEFPREQFRLLGRLGLLGLAYPEEVGGGGQPSQVYLQVIEEIAARWATVAVGMSVHALACFPLATSGTAKQQRLLPDLLGGEMLGAYCLSEAQAGSDPGAMRATSTRSADGWRAQGEKAWVTHGGVADFYTALLRTGGPGSTGISCFHVPADTPGLSAAPPEHKMGLTGSVTAAVRFDEVELPADALVGEVGTGLTMALAALDAGRLGIAAISTGVAQAALDYAVTYAREREAFGRRIIDHQGLAFLLADMDAAVAAARATYLWAARRKDAGRPYRREASIAKLVASDNAMRVCTDAVQVLGGAGYTTDHPVERYMREVKVMQIFEGTNQIQRMIIGRELARD